MSDLHDLRAEHGRVRVNYATLAVGVTGDLDLARLIVRGREAVLAECIARVLCVRGNYAWDLRDGVDPTLITGYQGWYGGAVAEIERVLAATPGVAAVAVREDSTSGRIKDYIADITLSDSSKAVLSVSAQGNELLLNL